MEDILGSLMTLLAFLGTFGAVFFLLMAIWEGFLKKFMTEARGLEDSSTIKAFRKVVLRRMATINQKFIWPNYDKRIRRRITHAGGLDGLSPTEFMAAQQISVVGFTLFGLILLNFMNDSMGMDVALWHTVWFTILGWFFPEIWLRDQVVKRHFKMTRELPYNLDLLTLSVEAGLDFQAAVDTVGKKGRQGPLTDEFATMLKELRMGKTRQEALRSMADRVGLAPLSRFIQALIQADRMGTSLGKVLRIQSTQLRIERTQRAEKLANEAPVKMIFPLVACIFPTVFIVLFSPIIFQLLYGKHG
ncbi:MAG: type II secretion system F family protein [Deltaproteobacteria bacterium]|nr:type II secretion system F family protein [Deltaproteobacteria bacterium]